MTGTTNISTILNQLTLTENIVSHLTDPQDFKNLTQINRGTYISLTQPDIARHIWSQFVGGHHRKVPTNLCVSLSFRPCIHRYEDGTEIETLGVYEIILSQTLERRSVMQSRQIPYIVNPTLHLVAQDEKLKYEIKCAQSYNPGKTITSKKPTRDMIMRKEVLNWLMFLHTHQNTPEPRLTSMYYQHIDSSFDFDFFFNQMVVNDLPDLEITGPDKQQFFAHEDNQEIYRLVTDILLSGDLSFDEFKSLLFPTPSEKTSAFQTTIFLDIFSLYQQVKDNGKVQAHPLDTLHFFKRVLEIAYFAPLKAAPTKLTQIKNMLVDMISLPQFSAKTFSAVFLPKRLEHESFDKLVNNLESFLDAVQHGDLDLRMINDAFEKNPKLHLPLLDMNNAFYNAVNKGFIPLSSMINSRSPITDFYEACFLSDVSPQGPSESDIKLDELYNLYMTEMTRHPDFQKDRESLIREAAQFLKMMKSLSSEAIAQLLLTSDGTSVYNSFLSLRERMHNLYQAKIEMHCQNKALQDIMLSPQIKDFIGLQSIWDTIKPTKIQNSFDSLLKTLDTNYKNVIGQSSLKQNLLELSTFSVSELEEATKQIDLLLDNQDPANLTPALSCLMSLHLKVTGSLVNDTYRIFGKLPSLFKQSHFPVQFSIWDLLKADTEYGIFEILQSPSLVKKLQSLQDEEWITHITTLKNEVFKLGAQYFGSNSAYQICESFFSSPQRTINSLLLLASGKWNKQDFINVIKTYVAMHYSHMCLNFYQYDVPGQMTNPRARINIGLPQLDSKHLFDPEIFVNEFIKASIETYLYNTPGSPKTLWNNACKQSDKGELDR